MSFQMCEWQSDCMAGAFGLGAYVRNPTNAHKFIHDEVYNFCFNVSFISYDMINTNNQGDYNVRCDPE